MRTAPYIPTARLYKDMCGDGYFDQPAIPDDEYNYNAVVRHSRLFGSHNRRFVVEHSNSTC